jgi:3-methyl-2-oxobutanoate hydroxymethyltransferase
MKITIQDFLKKKREAKKIVMLTVYDFPFGRIFDEAGLDAVLVGDSLAMVVQGLENTLPVTMDEMIYHTKMVSRSIRNAMIVGDMPYLSYHISVEESVFNAGRFMKEAGAGAVKLEGGREVADKIRAIAAAEIPVMGHIGLTPQAFYRMGGFKVQGKTEDAAQRLLDDAKAVEDAGAFTVVVEGVPADLAGRITAALSIPTIGIGAGPQCDGQILVMHDMLGLFERFTPKFVKKYADLRSETLKAVKQYKDEVEKGSFPGKEHSF